MSEVVDEIRDYIEITKDSVNAGAKMSRALGKKKGDGKSKDTPPKKKKQDDVKKTPSGKKDVQVKSITGTKAKKKTPAEEAVAIAKKTDDKAKSKKKGKSKSPKGKRDEVPDTEEKVGDPEPKKEVKPRGRSTSKRAVATKKGGGQTRIKRVVKTSRILNRDVAAAKPPPTDPVVMDFNNLEYDGGLGAITEPLKVYDMDYYLYINRMAFLLLDYPKPEKFTTDLTQYKLVYDGSSTPTETDMLCKVFYTIMCIIKSIAFDNAPKFSAEMMEQGIEYIPSDEDDLTARFYESSNGLTMDAQFIVSMFSQDIMGDPSNREHIIKRYRLWTMFHDIDVRIKYMVEDQSGNEKEEVRPILSVVQRFMPGLLAYMTIMWEIDLRYPGPMDKVPDIKKYSRDKILNEQYKMNLTTVTQRQFSLYQTSGREMMDWVFHKYQSFTDAADTPYHLLNIEPFFLSVVTDRAMGGKPLCDSIDLSSGIETFSGIYENEKAYKLSVVCAATLTLLPALVRQVRSIANIKTADAFFFSENERETEVNEMVNKELDKMMSVFGSFDNVSTDDIPTDIENNYLRMKTISSVDVVGARALGLATQNVTCKQFAEVDLSDGEHLLSVSTWVTALWRHKAMSSAMGRGGQPGLQQFILTIDDVKSVYSLVRANIISLSNGRYAEGNDNMGNAGLGMFLTMLQQRDPFAKLYNLQ